jgi:hypothetical protein
MERTSASMTEILSRADNLYSRRADIDCVIECVQLLKSVEIGEFEITWRLGRAWFFLGQEARDCSERRKHYKRGIEASERAVTLKDERVEGHFWLGVNLALLAAEVNVIAGARLALQARRALLRAVAIDAGFHGAGPLRVLAKLEQKLPKVLGGGIERSRGHFDQAIQIAPGNTVTRIYYAELLLKLGEHASVKRQLEAVLNSPDDAYWQFEIDRDKRLAKEMLEGKQQVEW